MNPYPYMHFHLPVLSSENSEQLLIRGWSDRVGVYTPTMEQHSVKKEVQSKPCIEMDEPQEHYAK